MQEDGPINLSRSDPGYILLGLFVSLYLSSILVEEHRNNSLDDSIAGYSGVPMPRIEPRVFAKDN